MRIDGSESPPAPTLYTLWGLGFYKERDAISVDLGGQDDLRAPTHSSGLLPIVRHVVGLSGPWVGLLLGSVVMSHPRCMTPTHDRL